MATTKPRVTITLEPEHYSTISELASLRDVSRSSVITEMLSASMPVLERTAVVLRALKAQQEQADQAQREAPKQVLESMEEAERTIAPLLAKLLGMFDDLPSQIENPRSCNTGVTPSSDRSLSKGPSRSEEGV